MNAINEYEFDPGVYKHYKGTLYVATELVTHMDGPAGKMQPLEDPLVCYRDLAPIYKHIDGKPKTMAHQVYARPLSTFFEDIGDGRKRFTKQ